MMPKLDLTIQELRTYNDYLIGALLANVSEEVMKFCRNTAAELILKDREDNKDAG